MVAIQPRQAREAKEKEQAKRWASVVASIEAGIDDQIRKWEGDSVVKYHTKPENLVYYVTKELTTRYHGWMVTFDTKGGWITLTAKREEPSIPWKDTYPNDWGGPYKAPPRSPWDTYPKVWMGHWSHQWPNF